MEISSDDVKFLKKEHSSVISELHDADSRDYQTKKGLITRLVEVSRKMVENELILGIKLNDLASYINGRLDEYGIKYPRNQDYYNLFSEKEKRDYGTNSISMSRRNHEHNFEDFDQYTKKCQCGVIQFCGMNYEKRIEPIEEKPNNFESDLLQAEPQTQSKKADKVDPYDNQTTEYLQRAHYNALDLAELTEDIVKKFYSSDDIAKVIEEALGRKIGALLEEQKSLEATLIHMKKQTDFRQKVGEFEKIKGIILEKTTYNVAKVAKMLSITPKHMTNNIIRNVEEFKRHMKWFRSVILKCSNCSHIIEFEMASWYNEQLVRKNLDLELRQPTKT